MRKKIIIFVWLLIGALVIFIGNSFFRWDQRVTSPIAYKIGMQMDWYEGQEINLTRLKVGTIEELEEKLEKQGFVAQDESATGLGVGFHRKDGGLRWYTFEVDENTIVYQKEFITAAGLCSQSAGVAISPSNKSSVRFLNPGGTCV